MRYKITKSNGNYYIRDVVKNKTLKTAYASFDSAKASLDYRLFTTSLQSDKDYSKKLRDCVNAATGVFSSKVEQQSDYEIELDSLCSKFGIDET